MARYAMFIKKWGKLFELKTLRGIINMKSLFSFPRKDDNMGKDLKGKELGEGFRQKKNGIYSARFVNRFGERIEIYERNLSVLKDKFNKAIYEDNMKLNIINSKVSLDEWYIKWLTEHKYKVIRNSTKIIYENIYSKYISPVLGKMKLGDITHLQIKSLINNVDKKGLGFETQNKIRILLLDMFNKAMIDELVNKNPAKGIKLVRNVNEDSGKDIRTLSLEEQALFFECCKGTFYDNLFVVAITTGLRCGEITALTMDDIDFDKGEISITKTLLYQKLDNDNKKTFQLHPPKTKSSIRTIPINRQCEIALKKQILQKAVITSKSPKSPIKGFNNLLFTTKFNTPINAQIYSDAIKAIISEINLTRDELEEIEPFSSHCFRHTFATRCIECNIQPKTVQAYLGHASLQMTMDLYVKTFDDHKKEEMIKFENSIDTSFLSSPDHIEEKYNKLIDDVKNSKNVVKFRHDKMA
jgi:integrase